MAPKRNKPALYELIGKGRVKPDDKGALGTPKWFYGEGEQEVQTEPVRQEPKVIIHQGPRIPKPAEQEATKEPVTAESRAAHPEKEFGLQLGKKIRPQTSRWQAMEQSIHSEEMRLKEELKASIDAGNPNPAHVEMMEQWSQTKAGELMAALQE